MIVALVRLETEFNNSSSSYYFLKIGKTNVIVIPLLIILMGMNILLKQSGHKGSTYFTIP